MLIRLQEVEIKHQRLIGVMEKKNLNAIFIRRQNNFAWATGGGINIVWTATEVGMNAFLLFLKNGERFLICNTIEAPRMEGEELSGLGFKTLSHEWFEDREAELVKQAAGDLDKVGCDVPFFSCPVVSQDVQECRYSLLDCEIDRFLFLGRRLSEVSEKVLLGLRPGDTDCDLAGRAAKELWKDRIDVINFMIAADERAFDFRHPVPVNRMIKKYVMFCCNARYKGFITTITRIAHIGKIDPKLKKQYEDNVEIECRMIAASRPGVPTSVPVQIAFDAYESMGYSGEAVKHHQGGAMGYHARDTIATRTSKDLILENQAFCWNPSIAGTKSEDGFIVTAEGPLFITSPVIFPVLDLEIDGVRFRRPDIFIID